jgi:hemoglobin
MASLYDRLGGEAAITAVVDKFYEFMLADPIVAPFFAKTDMKKQAARQTQFLVLVTGGPNKYEGADMKKAHKNMKIGQKHFDETWINLQKAMAHFKVPEQEVGEVKEVFYSVQGDIVEV